MRRTTSVHSVFNIIFSQISRLRGMPGAVLLFYHGFTDLSRRKSEPAFLDIS
jgi:hypothetical protein